MDPTRWGFADGIGFYDLTAPPTGKRMQRPSVVMRGVPVENVELPDDHEHPVSTDHADHNSQRR